MESDLHRGFRLYGRTVLPAQNRITGDAEDAHVEPRTMAVLVCLAEHAGEVVSREFLDQHVWRGAVVTDHALTNCISELRRCLGDTRGESRFIDTVPKRGYRLIAPVMRLERVPSSTTPRLSRSLLQLALAVALVLLVVVAGGWWAMRSGLLSGIGNAPQRSIAVLQFKNLSTDKDNQYFVAGIQDLIITKLANVGGIKVISRSSTDRYQSSPADLQRVAAELGVATILEGSVQKAGDEVLINVQLIDASKNVHLWAHGYRRSLDDIFGVEGEVARKVAVALNARLSPAEAARLEAVPTTDKAAYNWFLRAQYLSHHGELTYNRANWKAAIPLYRKAIAEDPDFALAYARLSIGESRLAWWGGTKDREKMYARARSDAKRALRMQPDLAAAHVAMGYNRYYGDRDYAAAVHAFDAALALSPNDSNALAVRGAIQRRQGQFDAAIASLTRALEHDPRNSNLARGIGTACMTTSRYRQAKSWFERALALDPNNVPAKVLNARVMLLRTGDVARVMAAAAGSARGLKSLRVDLLIYQRKYRRAIALRTSIPDFYPSGFGRALDLADLHRLAGDASQAQQGFAQVLPKAHAFLDRKHGEPGVGVAWSWYSVGLAELGLGHKAKALDAVARARIVAGKIHDYSSIAALMVSNAGLYAQAERPDLAVPLLTQALTTPGVGSSYSPVLLWLDPAWDPIGDDPRFQALLKRYANRKPPVTFDSAPDAAASSGDRRSL